MTEPIKSPEAQTESAKADSVQRVVRAPKHPTQGQCQHCAHYQKDKSNTGWCHSINDQVLSWWTGCVRWRSNAAMSDCAGDKRES